MAVCPGRHTECPGLLGAKVDFDTKGLGWGLRFGFSTKLPWEADDGWSLTSFSEARRLALLLLLVIQVSRLRLKGQPLDRAELDRFPRQHLALGA